MFAMQVSQPSEPPRHHHVLPKIVVQFRAHPMDTVIARPVLAPAESPPDESKEYVG